MPLLYVDVIEGRTPDEIVVANLAARCGLDSADLVVSITDNSDEDWSFGYGRAQFLTGELI